MNQSQNVMGSQAILYNTISLLCTIRHASIYLRAAAGSKPLKRSDLTYDMQRLTTQEE